MTRTLDPMPGRLTDPLSDLLSALRVAGAVTSRSASPAGFAMPLERGGKVGFHVVLEGRCTIAVDGGAPVELEAGDVVLVPFGDAHLLSGDEPSALMCGVYTAPDQRSPLGPGVLPRLVADLPPLVVVRHGEGGDRLTALLQLLDAETAEPGPGSAEVVRRLVDVVLVHLLRAHSATTGCRGVVAALADPSVARALTAVHDDPAHRWTVESLAAEAGLSRAALARRWRDALGEPPLAYVTRWRVSLAGRLLATTDLPLAAVAARVGYESEFAFARAFKRTTGTSPGRWRTAA